MTGVRHHSRPAQHLNAQGARALTRDAGVGKGSVAVIVQRAETQPAVSPRSCGERETGEAGRVPASWQGQHERVAGQSWRCGKAAGRRYGGTRLSGPNPRISRNLFKVPSVQPQSHRQPCRVHLGQGLCRPGHAGAGRAWKSGKPSPHLLGPGHLGQGRTDRVPRTPLSSAGEGVS
ncbi:uncharacterized protein LOC104859472 isoform X4 [Fukomys damarensis]|uniref:uncharacterized protein LOC104859472 isoform X4 n=1 Tax=Fukomys damarensis TaxID=885580 RepID=UPI00053FBB07|nr:uncharacterized protein LOC104859472 isoform X4 [Fukomys damarensis]